MKPHTFSALSFAIALFLGTVSPLLKAVVPAQAQEAQNQNNQNTQRTIAFTNPPRLVGAENPEKTVAVRSSVYYFTLDIPADSGSGLRQVRIAQRDGASRLRRIRYDLEATRAYMGTPNERGAEIPIAQKTYDENSQTVTLAFANPVPGGTTVTIDLEAQRNPRAEGIYLFGVTAYPGQSTENGQFLGYTRLTFYGGDGFQLLPGM